SAYFARTKAACRRAIQVGSVLARDGIDLEADGSGGLMTEFFRKLAWLLRRRSKEAELQEEIRFHLEEEMEERLAAGLSQAEAERAARRDLGNVALVQEETRAAWGWRLWEQFLKDIRYAMRTMAANKTFTALAILSLALGIGANTAIFSFMDSI